MALSIIQDFERIIPDSGLGSILKIQTSTFKSQHPNWNPSSIFVKKGGEKKIGLELKYLDFLHDSNIKFYFFTKFDLLVYLSKAKEEFLFPTRDYINRKFLPSIYQDLVDKVNNLSEEIFIFNAIAEKDGDNARAYIQFESSNDTRIYSNFIDICLSTVTSMQFQIIEDNDNNKFVNIKPVFNMEYTKESLNTLLNNLFDASNVSESIYYFIFKYGNHIKNLGGLELLTENDIFIENNSIFESAYNTFTSLKQADVNLGYNLPSAIEVLESFVNSEQSNNEPLQQIYFGAPGTGKSHEIKKQVKKHKSFRITFHPDTDYSSFVGAYKPTSVEVPMLTTLGDKAIPMKDVDGNPLSENKIIYSYVKQAFLNAYIEAWKEQENETPKPVFLVIEEINRGNCAQIFGDIFQLLDRNDAGFSDYSIVPDSDLSRHVSKDLKDLNIANREKINAIYEECEADMVGKVLRGDVLLLPNNLYIWATMNTSDQSLFPIDSAFKRRWDWKYIKIANANKNWQIKIGSETFDWWQFVQAINYFVFDATKSEDKNLGYFFAKAKDKENTITAETFVSKVIFYLYTDVFKDYGFSGDIFKGLNDEEMTFQSFYNADGSPCNAQIIRFIKNVIYSDSLPKQLKAAEPTDDEDMNVYDEGEAVDNRTTSNHDKYKVNGVGSYGKCRAPFEAVKTYASLNPEMTAIEIASNWTNLDVNHLPHLVETEQQFEDRASSSTDNKFRDKAKKLVLPNNEVIYVSNQFNPIRIKELIDKLNSANLGVTISLIED